MTAFGAIARTAITRRPSAEAAGVIINIPATMLSMGVPANDVVAGALIEVGLSNIDFTAPANMPVGGTMVDIEFTQLVLISGPAMPAAGASIDTRETRSARRGCPIAGCAITRRSDRTYSYIAGTQIILRARRNDPAAGTLVDVVPSAMELTGNDPEVVARTRAIRSIAISS